jgi:hypothetical protein
MLQIILGLARDGDRIVFEERLKLDRVGGGELRRVVTLISACLGMVKTDVNISFHRVPGCRSSLGW